jgi:Lrp/AsnC family leucine-responsive transcriptional regulator
MSGTHDIELDATDWKLLGALQANARASFTTLGRLVGLSRPAVAERVRRLEEAGVITGYRVALDPTKVGLPITAYVRMHTNQNDAAAALTALLMTLPEVQECYRGTGGDCFTIKVVVSSVGHLDRVLNQLQVYGNPTTSVMLAPVITDRGLYQPGNRMSIG